MTILIGVDQGTSGTRAVAFDERCDRSARATRQPA
jgi:sugar (pentulose or hexulose) kinase